MTHCANELGALSYLLIKIFSIKYFLCYASFCDFLFFGSGFFVIFDFFIFSFWFKIFLIFAFFIFSFLFPGFFLIFFSHIVFLVQDFSNICFWMFLFGSGFSSYFFFFSCSLFFGVFPHICFFHILFLNIIFCGRVQDFPDIFLFGTVFLTVDLYNISL